MTFPVVGVLAVLCIGVLILQKFRLQTRLDDSCWWLINYSDITIIREPSVRPLKQDVLSGRKIKSARARLCECAVRVCLCSHARSVCLCLIQGIQGLSISTTGSQSGSGGSQSTFSNNSYGLRDKTGRENVYTTIGLYQVPVLFEV